MRTRESVLLICVAVRCADKRKPASGFLTVFSQLKSSAKCVECASAYKRIPCCLLTTLICTQCTVCCGQDSRGFLTVFSQLLLLLKSSAKRSFNSAAKGNGSNAKVASALICAQIPSKATRHPFKTAAQGIEVTSVKNILCGGREEGVLFQLHTEVYI